jgi:hypothetical protein
LLKRSQDPKQDVLAIHIDRLIQGVDNEMRAHDITVFSMAAVPQNDSHQSALKNGRVGPQIIAR